MRAVFLAGAAVVAGVLLLVVVKGSLSGPRNLILITIDTLRADHLGCYGYPRATSPSIDRLAGAGTLFEHARVQWPKTNASVASMLTSTYGSTNRVRGSAALLDRRLTTLAEMLAEEGYHCAAFVANAHLGRAFRFDQGFAEVHELWENRWIVHTSTINSSPYPNSRIAQEVSAWLENNRDKRFFLWVHFLDPHGPYKPPDDLGGAFTGDQVYREQTEEVPSDHIPGWIKDAESRTLGDYVANYDREIASTDAAVGEMLGELERLELARRSLLVLTADHGESLGEHRYFFQHGRFLYDNCLRVPLIVKLPGLVPAGRRVRSQVGLIDLVPTILDLLRLDARGHADQFEGSSFSNLFSGGGEIERRPVFSEAAGKQLSVVDGRWKLISDPRGAGYQLFDLSADPGEEKNLADHDPLVAAKLSRLMRSWREDRKRAASYHSRNVPERELEPGVRRQLESLGYLER